MMLAFARADADQDECDQTARGVALLGFGEATNGLGIESGRGGWDRG
jgi:hypothetical protein